jgi:tetratricopeptide (TPR) repeat protein
MSMHSFVRSAAPIAALASLGLGALILCAPAFANSPGPGGGSGESRCGKYPEGSKGWKKCMGQARQDLEDTYALGYWMAKTGEYDEALRLLQSAGDQNDPRVLTMIGFATRHLGRVGEALGYYEKALAANPNMTSTRQYLGEAFLQISEPAKAKLQLAEIAARCGTACVDYRDLAAAIAAYEKGGKS